MPTTLSAADFQAKYGQSAVAQFNSGKKQTLSAADWNAKYGKKDNTPKQGPVKSLFGKIWGGVKTVGSALTSSEQGVGQSLSSGIIPHLGIFKAAQTATDQNQATAIQLQQQIRDAKAQGKDTTHLEMALKDVSGAPNISDQYKDINPASQKSTGQALGEVAGVGLDVLSAGSYGSAAKGAETGKLLTGSEKVASLFGRAGLDVTMKDTAEQGAKAVAKQGAKQLFTKSAEGAAQGYGYDVSQNLQSGKTGAAILKPGAGTAVGALTPFATKLVGSLAKGITGKLTGAGTDVIDRAIQNPEAVQSAINDYAKNPENKMQLITQAGDALSELSKQKNQEYAGKLSTLVADKPISKDVVTSTFQTAVKNFGGRIDEKGNLIFGDTALTSADKTNLTNAWNDIKGWQDVTPQGMDTLRQNIGNNMKDFKVAGNPRANVVLGAVKTTLTQTMKDSIPGYSEMLSNYGDKAEAINNMAKEFQLAGTAKDTTKLNNILRLFKKDPSALANLTKVMGEQGAKDFQNEVAGAILSNWVNPSRVGQGVQELLGAGSLFSRNPEAMAGAATYAAASSPRIVGTGATLFGKGINSGLGTAGRRVLTREASQIKP